MVKQAACNVNKLQRMLPGIFCTTLWSVFFLIMNLGCEE
jgi:hypothetical protein